MSKLPYPVQVIAKKGELYTDENVSLPYDKCIVRLEKNNSFLLLLNVEEYIARAKNEGKDSLIVAEKCNGKAVKLHLYVIEYLPADPHFRLVHLLTLKNNLRNFRYIDRFTPEILENMIRTRNVAKGFGI